MQFNKVCINLEDVIFTNTTHTHKHHTHTELCKKYQNKPTQVYFLKNQIKLLLEVELNLMKIYYSTINSKFHLG